MLILHSIVLHINGLVQEIHNSSSLPMELCLYCTNPMIYGCWKHSLSETSMCFFYIANTMVADDLWLCDCRSQGISCHGFELVSWKTQVRALEGLNFDISSHGVESSLLEYSSRRVEVFDVYTSVLCIHSSSAPDWTLSNIRMTVHRRDKGFEFDTVSGSSFIKIVTCHLLSRKPLP